MNKQEHDYICMTVRYAAQFYHTNHPLCFESEYVDNKAYDALIDYVVGKIEDTGSLSQYCDMSPLTYIDIVYNLMRDNQNFYDDVLFNNESENDMHMFLQAISDKYDDLEYNLTLAFGDDDNA